MDLTPARLREMRIDPTAITQNANYERALEELLKREGGYVNDPDDPGGATRYGVSLRWLKNQGIDINGDDEINVVDIEVLTHSDAKRIYRQYWWDAYRYLHLGTHLIAAKVFDHAVNMGPAQAHTCLQRAVRANGQYSLAVDGILGPNTREAVRAASAVPLLTAYRAELAAFYRSLGVEKYLRGWLRRAYDV